MESNNLDNIRGKKILVVGMGKSGIASARVLHEIGAAVSVQDSKKEYELDKDFVSFLNSEGIETYFGCTPDHMGMFDMVVLSPGVSPHLEFIDRARLNGVEITGELEIAYRVSNGNFVAITGTNGKTTTTTLVGEMFKNAGKKTYTVGNIGVAVVKHSIEADANAWLITETSSFQLETIKYFKPVVSAILNLTEDHMDRHKTMENYGAAKARIFENQDSNGYLVINKDDARCFSLADGGKNCRVTVIPFSRKEHLEVGAFIKDNNIVIRDPEGKIFVFCGTEELQIPGAHNLENALAATAIAHFAGINHKVISETLRTFKGVEHRMEFCGEIEGILFVNDSKGTNPDASIKAIEATKGRMVLIAGGYNKNSTFTGFINAFNGNVKAMVLLGNTASKIKREAESLGFKNSYIMNNMDECVNKAYELAEEGDTVLLSPACASWDMYDSFEQRGDHFKKCVEKLRCTRYE